MNDAPTAAAPGLYARTPMFVRILIGLVIGFILGLSMKEHAEKLKPVSDMVLGLLRLLATPLVFLAITLSLLRTNISGRSGLRLLYLIFSNTLAAIIIGLGVVNLLKPGEGAGLQADPHALDNKVAFDVRHDLLEKILPKNFISPFLNNDILPLLVIAITIGFALKSVRREGHEAGVHQIETLMETLLQVVMQLLHGLFHLVPFAVCAVVAATVGKNGFAPFHAMGHFVLAVLLALGLQGVFYLCRVRLNSWVRPLALLRGGRDALITAFSTASSTATLPITLECARDKLKLREKSASMGVIVGGNLNNDGTALYEAMAALFVAQALGIHLDLSQQLIVVIMSVVASVGAAGIPEAGLVTMMAVFAAVKLPIEYIPLLLTVDWFLDRCRTVMNVMGDLTVSCILDGRTAEEAPEEPLPAEATV